MVSDLGPSNDYTTMFYTYDGEKIKDMGITEGLYKQGVYAEDFGKALMDFPGDGTFTTSKRGAVLHTWFYDQTIELDENHLLVEVPQSVYKMDYEVTVLKDLPLVFMPEDDTLAFTLKAGEKATLVWTDDVEWVSAKNEDGEEGWFKLEDPINIIIDGKTFPSYEVFEGLNMAD